MLSKFNEMRNKAPTSIDVAKNIVHANTIQSCTRLLNNNHIPKEFISRLEIHTIKQLIFQLNIELSIRGEE